MQTVAFIGLGAMGSRMATNLLRAGYALRVYDPNTHAVEHLAVEGARATNSPREAAEGAQFAIGMVPNDDVSREIWLDGTDGALKGMRPGVLAIECSTLTPAWVRDLSRAMREHDIQLLDAMVSGSTPQAESRQLTFLVGGEAASLKIAKPILLTMGAKVQYAGDSGSGALAKLITNALMGVQLTTLAEMVGVLRREDVDPKQVLSAVAGTAMWNAHLEQDAERMLKGSFQATFPVRLLAKDLRYVTNTAGGEPGAPTVVAAQQVLEKALAGKLGDLDMTAVVKLFEPAL